MLHLYIFDMYGNLVVNLYHERVAIISWLMFFRCVLLNTYVRLVHRKNVIVDSFVIP
jgi:hypothetical protein